MINFKIESHIRTFIFTRENWLQVQYWAFWIFCVGFLGAKSPVVFYLAFSVWTFSSCWGIIAFGFNAFFESFSRKKVLIFFLIQSLGWIYAYYQEYFGLGFNFYDTGILSNPVSNFIAGHGFFNSELQIKELSDHFCPNLLLLSPFYYLWNSPIILILAKFSAYLFSFLTLYRFCRFMKVSEYKTSFVLFLWTVNVGVNNYMDFEFQPSILIVPFVFLLFELVNRQKFIQFCLVGIFIFGFKENAGLVLASIGVYRILYFKEWKTGTLLIGTSFVLTMLIIKVLIPYFGSGQSIHIGMINPFCCPLEKVKFTALQDLE